MIARTAVLLLAFAVAGCKQGDRAKAEAGPAGASLERAAIGVGIIADPAKLDPVGAYASDTDRVCIVANDDGYRIGASVDYGDQQGCVARGNASGRDTLGIDFAGGCRLDARLDGERIIFSPTVPAACERLCTGRATLAAISAPRLSGTATEARAMRGADGQPLCD